MFGAGAVTYGTNDLFFQPKTSTWGKFITDILTLRREFDGQVYSTSVTVNEARATPAAVASRPHPRRVLAMPSPNSPLFRRWGRTLEHRLRNLYFGLSNLLQDPLVGECFEDLRPMAELRLPRLLQELDSHHDDQIAIVQELVEVLAYATEERAHGAFLSLEQLANLSPTKGGIQRILTAAAFIPKSLLARVGKQWFGCIVAGYHNEFFLSHYEAINLPFEYLFRPEKWCGLFHEVGHTAFFDMHFYNMAGPELAHIIRGLVPGEAEDSPAYLAWMDMAWEIGADMFDLYFCYGIDLDLYCDNIWPFLIRSNDKLTFEHFRRYFLIFQFWKHLLLPNRSTFSNIDIDGDIEEFCAHLRARGLPFSEEAKNRREARTAFCGMAQVAEAFCRRFRQIAPARDLATELKHPEIIAAVSSVKRGRPWSAVIDSPDVFILALGKERRLNLAARMAAIISLWNSAVQSTRP
jgi:hypothetical protein